MQVPIQHRPPIRQTYRTHTCQPETLPPSLLGRTLVDHETKNKQDPDERKTSMFAYKWSHYTSAREHGICTSFTRRANHGPQHPTHVTATNDQETPMAHTAFWKQACIAFGQGRGNLESHPTCWAQASPITRCLLCPIPGSLPCYRERAGITTEHIPPSPGSSAAATAAAN